MDFKEVKHEGLNWIHLAQGGNQLLFLVSTGTNLKVPLERVEFLD
jgi:hypothetical protein